MRLRLLQARGASRNIDQERPGDYDSEMERTEGRGGEGAMGGVRVLHLVFWKLFFDIVPRACMGISIS